MQEYTNETDAVHMTVFHNTNAWQHEWVLAPFKNDMLTFFYIYTSTLYILKYYIYMPSEDFNLPKTVEYIFSLYLVCFVLVYI